MSIPSDVYKLGKTATAITVNNNDNAKIKLNRAKDSVKKQLEMILTFLVLVSLFFLQCLSLHFTINWVHITSVFGAMFWCSLVVSRSMFKSGRITGENTEAFKFSKNRYLSVVNKLNTKEHRQIDNFCEHLHDEDLRRLRINILKKAGIEYEEYKNKKWDALTNKQVQDIKELSQWQKKIVTEANRLDFEKISSEELLNDETQKKYLDCHFINKSMEHEEKKALCSNIISAIILALPFALLAIELARDFSWHSVFWYIVQICFIFIKSIPAYFKGVNLIKTKGVTRYNQKWHILCIFEEWYKENFEQKEESKETKSKLEQSVLSSAELPNTILGQGEVLGQNLSNVVLGQGKANAVLDETNTILGQGGTNIVSDGVNS